MPDFGDQGGKVDGRGVTPTQVVLGNDVACATEYRMCETSYSSAVRPSNFLLRGMDV